MTAGGAWNRGLTDEQYVAYGRALRAIHSARVPAGLPEETFAPPSVALLRSLTSRVSAHPELAVLWRAHDEHIEEFLTRTEDLRAEARATEYVLCHTDIHLGNVLVGPDGGLSIVDWDAPVRAPRERDLVFVLAGPWSEQPVTARRRALFNQGYGRYEVHRPTLEYYRTERLVDDIGRFALRILDPAVDEPTKRTDLYWLRRILEPANP